MAKKKMKTWVKVIIIIPVVLVVLFAGIYVYFTSGMEETKNAVIEDVNLSSVPDGVYTGEFTGNRWGNTLEVTVASSKITDIKIVKDQMVQVKGVSGSVFEQVVQKQSLDVDAVAEATVSTKGYLLAIQNALQKK